MTVQFADVQQGSTRFVASRTPSAHSDGKPTVYAFQLETSAKLLKLGHQRAWRAAEYSTPAYVSDSNLGYSYSLRIEPSR